jgi:hypothetical protein
LHGLWLLALALALAEDPAATLLDQLTGEPAVHPEERTPVARGADLEPRTPRDGPLDVHGEVRGRIDLLGGPTKLWFSSRVLAGLTYTPTDATRFVLEVEALNGRFAGDVVPGAFRPTRADFRDMERVLPRAFHVRFAHPVLGRFLLGLTPFEWGLGLRHNAGRRALPFGDPDQGDVVGRLSWHAPVALGLEVFGAADVVLRDADVDVYEGRTSSAARVGVRWQTARTDMGVLTSFTWAGDGLELPISGYARHTIGDVHTWTVAAEGTGDPLGSGGAGLVRLRFDHDPARLSAALDAGLAAGDVAFHPDHQVGLLLFEHLDPAARSRTTSAVSEAVYLQPWYRHRVGAFELRMGTVTAWRLDGDAMGTEVLAGLRHRTELGRARVELGMEGGAAAPGGLWALRGRIDLTW